MPRKVAFRVTPPPVECRWKRGYLDWSGKKPKPCTEEEFIKAYVHFVTLGRWCVSWGKPMELEEIRIFLNKFCGYYFPDQDYDICMKPFIYKPVVDPDERRRKETKLMATIKAITLMGNEIKFDLIDDLVKDSFAIIRPNTF